MVRGYMNLCFAVVVVVVVGVKVSPTTGRRDGPRGSG